MLTPLTGIVEDQERLEGGAKGLAALRLLLASLAIAVTTALGAASAAEFFGMHPVYAAAVAACVFDVAYLLLLRYARAARGIALLATAGLAFDILLGSALVYLTGGYESAFLPLLFVWVIAAGTVLSGRLAFGAASLAVVCLSAALILRHFGLYPGGTPGRPEASAELWRAGAFHLAQAGAFFIVAYLAGALSRQLAAAELVADQVLASLDEGLVVLDRELRVRFANREAERLLGAALARGSTPGESLSDDRLVPVRRLLSARKKFGPVMIELPAKEGGRALPLAVSGAPVLSPQGAFRGLIAVISDRSAERELEDAQRVAEQRRAVSELAMSIAHEIRNPLGAIRSAVQEIGREGAISEGSRELVGVVLGESDRLDRIVTDFLTYARPKPPALAPLRLRPLVEEAQDMVARGAGGDKKLRMVNEVEEALTFRADAGQLRQALLNLMLNSAAAIDGQGRIAVGAHREARGKFLSRMGPARRARLAAAGRGEDDSARPGLVLEVRDDGCGMEPDVLHRAGEPFYTTRTDGTGLGLAIVERIAAAHGGAVNVESEPGRGTIVRVWLPLPEEKTDHA